MSGGIENWHWLDQQTETTQNVQFWDILSWHKAELLQKLESVQNPTFKKLAQEELQELQNLEQQRSSDIDVVLKWKKEFLQDLDALDFAEENFKEANPEWYKEFLSYISNGDLSESEQEKLYTLFHSDGDDIVWYFEDEGYIINRETYNIFAEEYWIREDEKDNQIIEDSWESNEIHRNTYQRIQLTLHEFTSIPLIVEFDHMITALEGLEWHELQSAIEDITIFLKESQNLESILNILRKQDQKNLLEWKPTNYYESFVTQVRDLSPDIAAKIQAFELDSQSKNLSEKPRLRDSTTVWGIPEGSVYQQSDNPNLLVAETPEGDIVTIDQSQIPPARFLSLGDSDYKLETDLPVGEFYEPTVAYEKVRQEFSPKAQKTENAITYLEHVMSQSDIIEQKWTLEAVKKSLKKILGYTLFSELGIQNTDSIEWIRSSILPTLKNNLRDYKEKLEKAEKKYKDDLDAHISAYRKSMEIQDKKVKEVLTFLRSIGFTDIPQSITDQIISMLNSSPALRQQLGFNEKIDFADGQLGIDTNIWEWNWLDLNDKVAFAEFVNRMIGVSWPDGKPPINTAALRSGNAPVWDKMRFTGIISDSGLMNAWGVSTALKNLSKPLGGEK